MSRECKKLGLFKKCTLLTVSVVYENRTDLFVAMLRI
jgi:hypothetical protein